MTGPALSGCRGACPSIGAGVGRGGSRDRRRLRSSGAQRISRSLGLSPLSFFFELRSETTWPDWSGPPSASSLSATSFSSIPPTRQCHLFHRAVAHLVPRAAQEAAVLEHALSPPKPRALFQSLHRRAFGARAGCSAALVRFGEGVTAAAAWRFCPPRPFAPGDSEPLAAPPRCALPSTPRRSGTSSSSGLRVPAASRFLRAWLGVKRTFPRPSWMLFELPPSAPSMRGRDVRRAGPLSPRLAGSCEPGPAASRRGRLRVLYGELSRPLSFGLFVVRPRLLPRGPRAPRLAGSFEPGLAHSRRGSLGVLHVSFFDLSLSASSMRGRGFCRGGLAPLG